MQNVIDYFSNFYRTFHRVFEGEIEDLKTLAFEASVRSVAWNHMNPVICAAGLTNGHIKIINTEIY